MQNRLSASAARRALLTLPDWRLEGDGLAMRRTYRFPDFAHAFGFMMEAALVAEKADHHPEWLNVYDRVDVRLTTHDAGGLSEKDLALARAMDAAANARGARLHAESR
jgi:4a-hydroxytetrahydrobiopterin dehydratase